MGCSEQTIRVYKGASRTFRITVRDADTGEAYDLSTLGVDDDIVMTVATAEGEAATFTKNLAGGVTVVTPHTGDNVGKADIMVSGDDTSGADLAEFLRYDVIMVLSGERYQLVEPSDFEILPVVTSTS